MREERKGGGEKRVGRKRRKAGEEERGGEFWAVKRQTRSESSMSQ